jgi:hypothetical protein
MGRGKVTFFQAQNSRKSPKSWSILSSLAAPPNLARPTSGAGPSSPSQPPEFLRHGCSCQAPETTPPGQLGQPWIGMDLTCGLTFGLRPADGSANLNGNRYETSNRSSRYRLGRGTGVRVLGTDYLRNDLDRTYEKHKEDQFGATTHSGIVGWSCIVRIPREGLLARLATSRRLKRAAGSPPPRGGDDGTGG